MGSPTVLELSSMAIDLAAIIDVVNLRANDRRLGVAMHGVITTLNSQPRRSSSLRDRRRNQKTLWVVSARSSTRLGVS